MGRVPPTIVASSTTAVRRYPRRLAETISPEVVTILVPVISTQVPCFDVVDVVAGEVDARGGEEGIDLVSAAEAGDGPVHGRVPQRPRDRDRSRRGAVAASH